MAGDGKTSLRNGLTYSVLDKQAIEGIDVRK